MKDVLSILVDSNIIWPFISVLIIIVFFIVNAIKHSNVGKRLKSIKILGNELEFNDERQSDVKPTEVSSNQNDTDVFINILKTIIDESVDLAINNTLLKWDNVEKIKSFIKMKLSYVTAICINDYSMIVGVNSDDALVFEKVFDKDIKSIFIGRLENEINKTISEKNDNELKSIVDDVCLYAKSQMIMYLSRYSLVHSDDAKKIFEKHIDDINSVVYECLYMIKTSQVSELDLINIKVDTFNKKVDSLLQSIKPDLKSNKWWPLD